MFNVTTDGVAELGDDELQGIRDAVNAWKASELDALGALGLGAGAKIDEEEDSGLEPPPQAEPAEQVSDTH